MPSDACRNIECSLLAGVQAPSFIKRRNSLQRHESRDRTLRTCYKAEKHGPEPAPDAPMTAVEALAAAAAEGLELRRSVNSTGFKNVTFDSRPYYSSKPYKAELRHGGRPTHLGYFMTPEEAALTLARFLNTEGEAAALAKGAEARRRRRAARRRRAEAREAGGEGGGRAAEEGGRPAAQGHEGDGGQRQEGGS